MRRFCKFFALFCLFIQFEESNKNALRYLLVLPSVGRISVA